MSETNLQFLLKDRPKGLIGREHFERIEAPIPVAGEGEVLVRTHYISLDPAMRGWVNEGRSYIPPVGIGEVMRAMGAGQIAASNHEAYAVGDFVTAMTGAQAWVAGTPKSLNLMKVDPQLIPLQRYIGAMGMPGMTAYFGLLTEAQPQEGETVVVSGAAGAVGSIVGQIAKIKGCRVVGIAGGAEKCKLVVDELGFDACIDYKNSDVHAGLKQHCPDGVNVYFDNVGGEILDAVLTRLAMHARVIICGAISQYNNSDGMKGPANYLSLLVNRASMKGMVVMDYAADYRKAGMEMAQWMMQGKLKVQEHIVEGLDTFPETLQMLFKGENVGKLVIKVIDD